MHYIIFHRLILAAVLSMARISGAFAICPALTDSMVPGVARRTAIFGFSVLVFPVVLRDMPPGEPNMWMFGLLAGKEAMIGFLIGFFAAIPFWIAENLGNFIDNQRGATMGEVYSPLSGAQVSTLGIFFTQITSTLFFVGGAIFLLLSALYKSFLLWPVFSPWFSFVNDAPLFMLGTLDNMLKMTLIIAAPVIIVMFLATLGLGLVNRTAPQLNVFFLSMPIKSALGVGMLVIYIPYILDMLIYTDDAFILNPIIHLLK